MTVIRGDCVEVMVGMEPDSVDAIVTDPPYGIGFMGHQWDQPGEHGPLRRGPRNEPGHPRTRLARADGHRKPDAMEAGKYDLGRPAMLRYQDWCTTWGAAMLRVAKPGAYAVVAGGPRTVHRLTAGLEDAGWLIRDVLIWAFAQGFPKSRASLKPAYEPLVLCRKPGPLRELNIDAARLPTTEDSARKRSVVADTAAPFGKGYAMGGNGHEAGRWPANVILTDPVLDGGWEGVVGGGWQTSGGNPARRVASIGYNGRSSGQDDTGLDPTGTEGTYSRFFLIPDARSTVLSGTMDTCPTCSASTAERPSGTRVAATDTAATSAPATLAGPSDRGASGAASPSLWAGTSTAPRPAPTPPDGTPESTGTGSAEPPLSGSEPTTSATGTASSSVADASTRSIPRNKPPATSPGSTPPSDPARSPGAASLATATTTTTGGPSTCGTCAGRITSPTTRRRTEPSPEEPGAARFLLIPKAPTRERRLSDGRRSPHPTQKPEALIRHLVTLVTPPGGLVLDPFLGSGTLGVVCDGLGVRWVGIEREAEYVAWAEARIADNRPWWMSEEPA